MARWDSLTRLIEESRERDAAMYEQIYKQLLHRYMKGEISYEQILAEGKKKNPTQVDPEWGPVVP